MADDNQLETVAAAPEAPVPTVHSPIRRRLSHIKIGFRVALGLLVGFALTEAIFRQRDEAAFPLVNVYASDTRCGVRLEPGASTRVGHAPERITSIRVNHDGFRGPEWGSPSGSDILVVGDSQSFGLGVEDEEAFPAQLGKRLSEGRASTAVLDASVPTYGPGEYAITIDRVLAQRTPGTVVVSINLLNDFFELEVPNVERHAAFDGWAIRRGIGPDCGESSALVEKLIQTSHTAFALWRWRQERRLSPPDVTLNPDFHELANLVTSAEQADREADSERERARQSVVTAARTELAASKAEIVQLVRKYQRLAGSAGGRSQEWKTYVADNGDPTDQIFEIEYGGCEARSGTSIVSFAAARIRDDVEATLKDFAKELPGLTKQESSAIYQAFERRDAAEKAVAHLPDAEPPPPRSHPAEKMSHWIGEIRSRLPPSVRLVVVAIPLDVQASLLAQARHGITDSEVRAIDRLVVDLGSSMDGVVAVNPTESLRAIGDRAYLEGGHLSVEGHATVARALAEALRK